MLISYRHRFLFVHIAKTGGTSVRAALRRYRWGGWLTPAALLGSLLAQATGYRVPGKLPRHAKALTAKDMLPAALWERLFKFTVVRNPYDLQVSSYLHLRCEHPGTVAGLDSFPAYIAHKFDPARAPEPLIDVSKELMSDYVTDRHGKLLVDFIARTENLDADFAEICRRIGLPALALPRERAAAGRAPYREYYDEESRAVVARHYARDLEVFGYDF